MGVLWVCWGFLKGDLEDRVIIDVMDALVWPQGRYPESFWLLSLLEVCQEWGVLNECTWRTLRVPDRRLGGQGHPWLHGRPCLAPRKILWKFHVNIFIGSVSRIGSPSWGYLEDIEGSWQVAWRTRPSLTTWMYLVDSKHHILKVLCQYLYFWQSYKHISCLSQNVTNKYTDTWQIYLRLVNWKCLDKF